MTNKEQAILNFWQAFGWPTYDEFSVPDGAPINEGYITFETRTGSIGEKIALTGTLWKRDSSWQALSEKLTEIDKALTNGGKMIPYDGGVMWVTKETPFSNRGGDDKDRMIKRIIINVSVEFI